MAFLRALAVAGESFVLSTGHKTILLDGGYSSTTLVKALGAPHLDVVICTHGDSDHAGGLTDLLAQTGAPTVGEFWLPGQWANHIEPLLKNPQGFVERMGDEIYDLLAEHRDFDFSRPFEDQLIPDLDGQDDGAPGAPGQDGSWSDTAPLEPDPAWWRALVNEVHTQPLPKPTWMPPPAPVHGRMQQLSEEQQKQRAAVVADAINTAKLIYEIAMQAAKNRVPVRWFDFPAFAGGQAPIGGWTGVLEPLNACELVTPPKPASASFARFIALSRINRHSLVFHALETKSSPSVLFCGDSPLKGGRKTAWPGFRQKPTRGFAATAPHHGRASNAGAYAIAEGWGTGGRIFWVRAGGGAKVPCNELKGRWRSCTSCAHISLRSVDLRPAHDATYGWWSYTGHCPWNCC